MTDGRCSGNEDYRQTLHENAMMNRPPVIRVELRGGLGNQLFQAAAGYALATRLEGELEFELFNFRTRTGREFALTPFPIGGRVIHTKRTFSNRLLRKAEKTLRPFGYIHAPSWKGPVLEEKSYRYDRRIEDVAGSCYLRGYFQSWLYFHNCSTSLKQAFDPFFGASDRAKEFASAMSQDALIVHVRAGDYLKDPKINAVHGVLDADYYHRAIQCMQKKGRASKIYCFSDNMPAALEILKDHTNISFVEGFSAADDLFLMSQGKSHIIANSTFSYWGAWLTRSTEPIVIAPRAWFSKEELKRTDTSDLYPSNWLIM